MDGRTGRQAERERERERVKRKRRERKERNREIEREREQNKKKIKKSQDLIERYARTWERKGNIETQELIFCQAI